MNSQTTKVILIAAAILVIILGGGAIWQVTQKRGPARVLETFGRVEMDSVGADGEAITSVIHTVGDFNLTDQYGRPTSQEQLGGKVYVADFFFTTCQSICIPMSKHMAALAQAYRRDDRVAFLSMTVDPETDSVPVLRAYAERHDAPKDKWYLVTGDKREIYALARNEYFVTATQGDGGPDDFVHTQNFALIDTRRQIRGYYDGTSEEEMTKLRRDLALLLEEEATLAGR